MAIIGGPLAGWLAPRCGIGYVTAGALLLGGLGEAGLLMASNGGPVPQILCLSVLGLGVGASIAATSLAIMSNAPAEHAGMAASLEEIEIEVGGAIGITVSGSVLAGVYSTILVLPNGAVLPPAVREGVDQALVVAGPCRPALHPY